MTFSEVVCCPPRLIKIKKNKKKKSPHPIGPGPGPRNRRPGSPTGSVDGPPDRCCSPVDPRAAAAGSTRSETRAGRIWRGSGQGMRGAPRIHAPAAGSVAPTPATGTGGEGRAPCATTAATPAAAPRRGDPPRRSQIRAPAARAGGGREEREMRRRGRRGGSHAARIEGREERTRR
jgi:hypothetical protein